MQKTLIASALLFSFSLSANIVQDAPLVSIDSHDAYFNNLKALCGKAFAGKIAVDNPPAPGFEGALIMHVINCTK